jgi:3',5'-cyclic AMP phosphodiesterase CpdA
MTTIAHLSDLHLLEDGWERRRGESSLRLRFCSLLRPRDPKARRERLRRGLRAAVRGGADHLVITGDLTEDGHDEQFEVLGDELRRGPLPPEAVTLVPGNHDAYTDGAAFERALRGPLSAWALTSRPGAVTRLGSTTIVALSTAVQQHYTRSIGALGGDQLQVLRATVTVRAFARGVVILALHHPPFGLRMSPLQWLDGLVEHRSMRGILAEHPHVAVLHGHTHRAQDRALVEGAAPQVFSCEAVVESDEPCRIYRAAGGRLWPTMPATVVASSVPPAVALASGW